MWNNNENLIKNLIPVSQSRVGHGDARSQESHQPDVDSESEQENHSCGST